MINAKDSFTVSPIRTEGSSVTLVPSLMNVVIGETRPLQALDSNGAPVTGLTWTSSDTSVATLSTDDPPVLTAVAAGHVTISAGDSSADVTVWSGDSLPLGTVIWSNPGDGSGVISIVPAVPSATGVADVFAVQESGALQALKSDGTVAWTAPSTVDWYWAYWIPDFRGGIVYADSTSVNTVDPANGTIKPVHTSTSTDGPLWIVAHTDGTIFAIDGDKLLAINPDSATVTHSLQLEHSTLDSASGRVVDRSPRVTELIVAGDGFAYASYQYQTATTAHRTGESITGHNETFLKIARLGTDGTSAKFDIDHWSQDYAFSAAQYHVDKGGYYCDSACAAAGIEEAYQRDPNCSASADCWFSPTGTCDADTGCTTYGGYTQLQGYAPFGPYSETQVVYSDLITNANTGVIVSYTVDTPPYMNGNAQVLAKSGFKLASVGSTGVLWNSAFDTDGIYASLVPRVQTQDGSVVYSAWFFSGTERRAMMAFDPSNGAIRWSTDGDYYADIATADGGVIASTGAGSYVTFDQYGRATGQVTNFPTKSLTGELYRLGSVDRIVDEPYFEAPTFYPQYGGGIRIPIDSKTNDQVSKILTSRMWQGFAASHCNDVLKDTRSHISATGETYSLDRIREKKSRTNFYSLDNPGINVLTVSAVTGGESPRTETLEQRIGSANAYTENQGFTRRSAIVLKKNFFSDPSIVPRFTFIHELVLHAYADESDTSLFDNTYLQQNGLWHPTDSTASTFISAWIGTDCRCTPGQPGSCTGHTTW